MSTVKTVDGAGYGAGSAEDSTAEFAQLLYGEQPAGMIDQQIEEDLRLAPDKLVEGLSVLEVAGDPLRVDTEAYSDAFDGMIA
jgi:hypothetical protein